MSYEALNISLSQESNNSEDVLRVFLDLITRTDVTATSSFEVSDWRIADFFYSGARFTAAYSELQESVRILSFKAEGAMPLTVFNASNDELEGFFCAWVEGC